jgi:hypothetical protein
LRRFEACACTPTSEGLPPSLQELMQQILNVTIFYFLLYGTLRKNRNKSALKFWEKAISEFTRGTYNKQIKDVTYDGHCPRRIIFGFDTKEFNLRR